MWWFWLLIGIIVSYIVLITIVFIKGIYTVRKHSDKKIYCNDCEQAFYEVGALYCCYCGKKLEYHKEFIKYINNIKEN